MIERKICALLGFTLVALVAAWTFPSLAQSTNMPPVIVESSTVVDPASLPLPAEGQKAVSDAITSLKSGVIVAHVTVASPDGKTWQTEKATKSTFINTSDLARQALEPCEYNAHGPCVIFEINGHDARDASGGWPTQPQMLRAQTGGSFNNQLVPFVSLGDRTLLGAYAAAASPKALVTTTSGGWTWSGGTSVFDAISKAMTQAQKVYGPNVVYLLYAVNDTVYFTP